MRDEIRSFNIFAGFRLGDAQRTFSTKEHVHLESQIELVLAETVDKSDPKVAITRLAAEHFARIKLLSSFFRIREVF